MNTIVKANYSLINNFKKIVKDSLYRNSFFLMMSGITNGFFSFIFWIIAAHLYTQHEVGQGTALIAAVGLTAGFGTLGFNNTVIRYLHKSKQKNRLLNSAFSVVAPAALFAGIVFLLLLPVISPSLSFIRYNFWFSLIFLTFVVSSSTNTIIDNTFIAYRSTHYTFMKIIILNLFELLFIISFVNLGAIGIFASYGLSFLLIILVGFSILIKRFKFKLKPCLDRTILKETAHFSLANYIVSYLNGFPALLLPIIITNLIGAKENAVYYIAYSISSLLFLIPLAVANSIFAEGSSSIETLGDTIKRASKILLIVMLPAIALMILFAPLILSFFGKQYSIQGIAILRILSLSGLFIAVCYPCGSILNILHKLRYLIFANFLGALSVILIVISFIKHGYGLVGVAWGWLIGWGLYTIIYLIFTGKALLSRNEKTHQVTS